MNVIFYNFFLIQIESFDYYYYLIESTNFNNYQCCHTVIRPSSSSLYTSLWTIVWQVELTVDHCRQWQRWHHSSAKSVLNHIKNYWKTTIYIFFLCTTDWNWRKYIKSCAEIAAVLIKFYFAFFFFFLIFKNSIDVIRGLSYFFECRLITRAVKWYTIYFFKTILCLNQRFILFI